jgi:hypothetical protein
MATTMMGQGTKTNDEEDDNQDNHHKPPQHDDRDGDRDAQQHDQNGSGSGTWSGGWWGQDKNWKHHTVNTKYGPRDVIDVSWAVGKFFFLFISFFCY